MHHRLRKTRVVEIALADVLGQALDAWRLATPHFRIDLRDIENIDTNIAEQAATGGVVLLVGIARNHGRCVDRELGDPSEHVFRRIRREVRDQLVVDGQVGSEDEKLLMPCAKCR